jgi:hypothetical protein
LGLKNEAYHKIHAWIFDSNCDVMLFSFFLMRGNDNDVFPKNVNFKYNEFLESSVFFKGDKVQISALDFMAEGAPGSLIKASDFNFIKYFQC